MSPCSPAGSSSSSLPTSHTLLALPDGPIPPDHPDLESHCISLIGGYPTFPPLREGQGAVPESIKCGTCHEAIPLLVQVYCPPEGGENDRTLHVWGCPRPKCQRRDGSVRAFRASVRNEEYVRDVEAKRVVTEKEAASERERARINPFSMSSENGVNGSTLFGGNRPLFGSSSSNSQPPFSTTPNSTLPDVSKLSISSSTTHIPPLPAYQPAQYLTTTEEYLLPPQDIETVGDDDDEETLDQKEEFRDARWEQLLPQHVDVIFERFVRRLENADGGAQQVLRHELGGTPMPYSSTSPLYRRLFPNAPTTATRSHDDAEEDLHIESYYDNSSIPACPRCKGKRVFELQLVPQLISKLQPDTLSTTGSPNKGSKKGQTEDERKKELARLAAGSNGDVGGDGESRSGIGEMEWGTVIVFGCEADCEGFGEEWVEVEWESTLS